MKHGVNVMAEKIPWPRKDWDESFEGRTFLTEEEWRTYRRRPPEKYPRLGKQPAKVCQVCQKPPTEENPLQYAHRIPARHGVWDLALTPEFLELREHMVWAHRKECNKSVELDFMNALEYLREHLRKLGKGDLPSFLPEEVRKAWRMLSRPERRAR